MYGGTHTNRRNATNRPHRNWKPFSVSSWCFQIYYLLPPSDLCFYSVCVWLLSLCYKYLHVRRLFPMVVQHELALPITPIYPKTSRLFPLGISPLRSICSFALEPAGRLASDPDIYICPLTSLWWHWTHQCDTYATEIILYGQSDVSLPSLLEFRTATTNGSSYPTPRQHVYDFTFFNVSDYKVFEYRPRSDISLPEELKPPIQTVILDMSLQRFHACPSMFNDTTWKDPNFQPAHSCPDVLGEYNETPYLNFSISTSSSLTFLRAKDKEYDYVVDAPAFAIYYSSPEGNLSNRVLLYSAVTGRNKPSILKVCSTAKVASAEVIGPLSVIMVALNQHSLYISRARIYSW